MKRFAIVGTLLVCNLLVSCGGSMSSEAQSQTEAMREALDDFAEHRNKLSLEITEVLDATTGYLNEQPPEIDKATKEWESGWKDVNSHYNDLKKDVETLKTRADGFFESLDELAAGMQSDSARTAETMANTELRNAWSVKLGELTQRVAGLETLLKQGDDQLRTYLSEAMRNQKSSLQPLKVTTALAKLQIEKLGQDSQALNSLLNLPAKP